MKPDAVAQDEGPRRAGLAGRIGFGEVAFDAAVRGQARQVVVQIDRAAPLVSKDAHDGVESAQILVERHREPAARLRLSMGIAAEQAGKEERARA